MIHEKCYHRDDIGACASCRNVRSFVPAVSIHDSEILIPYNGSKEARCVKFNTAHIMMSDEPRLDLPVNNCWSPIQK